MNLAAAVPVKRKTVSSRIKQKLQTCVVYSRNGKNKLY